MSVDLTRQELYDLVWSKPMMHAAKQFGISDVMLGRICKERNVPRPPRGYWANLHATSAKKVGRFTKPPLPNFPEPNASFDSFIRNEYAEREALRTDEFDPEDLNDPIRPPPAPPSESMDEFRERIEAVFPKLPDPEAITTSHPIVQHLMDYDVTLAALKRRGEWESPRYKDDKGKQCLLWLNSLLHWFECLGFEIVRRGKKNFTFHIDFLGHRKGFVFFIDERHLPPVQRKALKRTHSRTYCFRWDQETHKYAKGKNYYEFETITTECVKQIVMDVVMHDEQEYRSSLISNYRWRVERRESAIERREHQIQLAAAKKRKALERLLADREDMMSTAVASMNHADQIRDLIAIMQSKSQTAKKPIKDFERWVRWATHHANTLDPRYMSAQGFEAWIGKFKLKH